MAIRLTDSEVRKLPAPDSGSVITYDEIVRGFGVRVTATGSRSFIVNYRIRSGRERRYTIGRFPDYSTAAARDAAKDVKAGLRSGADPLDALASDRDAKTIADLWDRFKERDLPRKREATRKDYTAIMDRDVLPAMRHMKVSELSHSDIESLHWKVSKRGAKYLANRVVSVISMLMNKAIKLKWRADNPAIGIERNDEHARQRYLSKQEISRLTIALDECADQQGADIIRMLLLTGARKSEVLSAKWNDIDLVQRIWTKPAASTKQNKFHRVPLSAPVLMLLQMIRDKSSGTDMFVFPGAGKDGYRHDIKKTWRIVCIASGIVETVGGVQQPNARIHDLRHTYASILVNSGLSLPIIGALLGHSQAATTARYAHLQDDPLREATERVGAIVMRPNGSGADILQLPVDIGRQA